MILPVKVCLLKKASWKEDSNILSKIDVSEEDMKGNDFAVYLGYNTEDESYWGFKLVPLMVKGSCEGLYIIPFGSENLPDCVLDMGFEALRNLIATLVEGKSPALLTCCIEVTDGDIFSERILQDYNKALPCTILPFSTLDTGKVYTVYIPVNGLSSVISDDSDEKLVDFLDRGVEVLTEISGNVAGWKEFITAEINVDVPEEQ